MGIPESVRSFSCETWARKNAGSSEKGWLMEMACFDPRDPAQDVEKPETWKLSENPALKLATISMVGAGGQIDWVWVAYMADECERLVLTDVPQVHLLNLIRC